MAATQRPRPRTEAETDLERELRLQLETLNELGPAYSDTVAANFLEQIEHLIDQRVEQRLASRGDADSPGTRRISRSGSASPSSHSVSP